jgi:hypothetical protein
LGQRNFKEKEMKRRIGFKSALQMVFAGMEIPGMYIGRDGRWCVEVPDAYLAPEARGVVTHFSLMEGLAHRNRLV